MAIEIVFANLSNIFRKRSYLNFTSNLGKQISNICM